MTITYYEVYYFNHLFGFRKETNKIRTIQSCFAVDFCLTHLKKIRVTPPFQKIRMGSPGMDKV